MSEPLLQIQDLSAAIEEGELLHQISLEIGPGETLTNMIRRIDSAVNARSVREVLPEAGPC